MFDFYIKVTKKTFKHIMSSETYCYDTVTVTKNVFDMKLKNPKIHCKR